jgi:hypothetical protein
MTVSSRRVVLARRPHGEPKPSDFRVENYVVPTPGEGGVLLRTIWLSLDPYMRARMGESPMSAARLRERCNQQFDDDELARERFPAEVNLFVQMGIP